MISSSTATNVAWVGTIVLILGFTQSVRYAYRASKSSKQKKLLATIGNLVVACLYVIAIYAGFMLVTAADTIGKGS
jgi:hypothetical protein